MIPKVIHYCWFGNRPLPSLARKCIRSWKKYLPDYEIKEWNETNFDVQIISYTKEAYQTKKYAFVSDYARFWILYHYGGLYFDVDVELIKSIDDILALGPFMACEKDGGSAQGIAIAPGLGLASLPRTAFYKTILDYYASIHFLTETGDFNLSTVVEYTTNLLRQEGLKDKKGIQEIQGIFIYPKAFFCPLDSSLALDITPQTRSIHHYSGSWLPPYRRKIKQLKRLFGYSFSAKVFGMLRKVLLFNK